MEQIIITSSNWSTTGSQQICFFHVLFMFHFLFFNLLFGGVMISTGSLELHVAHNLLPDPPPRKTASPVSDRKSVV